jgi:DegV family protein with EDD domain
LRVVMDSAGDMPPNWASEYEIDVIPVNIQFKGKSYLQGVELSDQEFYRLADEGDEIPKTSQPTPYQFVEFYKKIAGVGDTILSMHVTGKLSGTFESAVIAAKELKDQLDIQPFDSASGSAALGFMCKEARLLDRAGSSIQTILERMEFIRHNIIVVLTLENLEYARKSGRVNALQAAIASVLDVKPIVILRDGALDLTERVRTRQKSIRRVIEIVRQRVGDRKVNVAVVHARSPEIAKELLARVSHTLNCNELIMTDLSIGVAANLGPGTVGIAAYPVEEGL